jgi:K+-transporting ATPase ATPase A chain
MTANGVLQILISLAAVVLLARPLGAFMARVFRRERTVLDPVLGPVERLIYRVSGIDPDEELDWKANTVAMLSFNVVGLLVLYAFQRLQQFLPLNPQGLGAVSPDSSFNTAVSFASNTRTGRGTPVKRR